MLLQLEQIGVSQLVVGGWLLVPFLGLLMLSMTSSELFRGSCVDSKSLGRLF